MKGKKEAIAGDGFMPTSSKPMRSRRQFVSGICRFGDKRQPCVTCNHFAAKTNCNFNKCKRCCGKDGSEWCIYHEVVYKAERKILLAKLQNDNRLERPEQHVAYDDFAEGTISFVGDTCVIFSIGNFLCIPEVQKWLHRLNKAN